MHNLSLIVLIFLRFNTLILRSNKLTFKLLQRYSSGGNLIDCGH